MKSNKRYTVNVAFIAMTVFLLMIYGSGRAQPTDGVDQTIHYLIHYVAESDFTFIRNAREYTPGEAAEHMDRKYQHFRDEIDTAEEFIERCATKSLMTGKPYLVVDGQGKELRTSDWLLTELASYQIRAQ